jgi:hypothetical protein
LIGFFSWKKFSKKMIEKKNTLLIDAIIPDRVMIGTAGKKSTFY